MSFNLPPLSEKEKERKASAFLDLVDTKIVDQKPARARFVKEKQKPMMIRFPISLLEDIREISALTGGSMNSVCLELLRPAVKKRLKELID